MGRGYYIDELASGMSATFGKTITDAEVMLFSDISGDTNPVHLDDAFAGASVFKGRIAHGLLVASLISTAIGTRLPGPGCIYVSQNLSFIAPVRLGDTVCATVTIRSLDTQRRRVQLDTVCRVEGKEVLAGDATVMVPRRPEEILGTAA